jgi:hypothetical protein
MRIRSPSRSLVACSLLFYQKGRAPSRHTRVYSHRQGAQARAFEWEPFLVDDAALLKLANGRVARVDMPWGPAFCQVGWGGGL